MAGISKKKTKNGIKYTITYRDISGRQHTSGLYSTKAEAKKDLIKFENLKRQNKDTTYDLIFSAFLEKVKNKNSINTYKKYNSYHNDVFVEVLNLKYNKIDSLSWQRFFDDLKIKKTPHVANDVLKFAKAAANYAIKHNLIDYNVFEKIEKSQTPSPDINHLTLDEIRLLLSECKKIKPEFYPLLFTFIGTGAREGEIFALQKEDFNPENKTITINKQFTRGRLFLKPKTQNSNRVIYLFDELADVLKRHIKSLNPDCPLLFPNGAGGYHNSSNFRTRFFYPLLKYCGINKRVRVHDLRGSYIDMVLSSGLSIKFAQNQVGHSKSETTLNVYARNNDDMIKSANSKINSFFEKTKKCENFVRTEDKKPNKKIIRFPKRLADTCF